MAVAPGPCPVQRLGQDHIVVVSIYNQYCVVMLCLPCCSRFFFLFTNFSMLPIQLRARKSDVRLVVVKIILSFHAMDAILNSLVKGVTSLKEDHGTMDGPLHK